MISHDNLFSLRNRTALVTGATGHLGRQMAAVLAAYGAHVLVNGRSATRAETVVDAIRKDGGSAETAVCDVTDPQSVAALFADMDQKPLHILINCAYSGGSGTIETAKADDFIKSYESAVVSTQSVFSHALPRLRQAVIVDGDATVINIVSMYGFVSPRPSNYANAHTANPPFYGAAKAALLQWTRYAACEFAQERIRINAISPGPFPSPEAEAKDPALMQRLSTNLPLGRMGRSDEIRSAVMFLASPASSFVTGTNIVVDGGWTSW